MPDAPYLVLFRSRRPRSGAEDGYAEVAQRMVEAASGLPGCLSIHSWRDPATGEGITVSRWADAASLKAWREDPEHLAAQAQAGRWYEAYELTVAQELRRHSWQAQGQAPLSP